MTWFGNPNKKWTKSGSYRGGTLPPDYDPSMSSGLAGNRSPVKPDWMKPEAYSKAKAPLTEAVIPRNKISNEMLIDALILQFEYHRMIDSGNQKCEKLFMFMPDTAWERVEYLRSIFRDDVGKNKLIPWQRDKDAILRGAQILLNGIEDYNDMVAEYKASRVAGDKVYYDLIELRGLLTHLPSEQVLQPPSRSR